MAVLTFENIKVEDLNERLLDSIRAWFKTGEVQISIVVKEGRVAVPPTLEEVLKRNAASPFVARFDADFSFSRLADQLEKDPDFDVMAVLEAHKVPNPYVAAS